jgi:1,4-dihydroxy-6-naphthoate synthase
MHLSLAYSPCPNDCFIFDAVIHGRIDTEGLEFDVVLADVESLNKSAVKGEYDITKLSFHAYAYVMKDYVLLRSGSALGFNCGPLLITRPDKPGEKVEEMKVAIPGKMTTANFLLSLAYPGLKNKNEMVFSDIEDAVLSGKADAGLIIHENRFTYEQKGLKKIVDLGEFWDSLIHAPIPLGGIAVKRNFDPALQQKINRVIRKSVEFAFSSPESSMPYVREHAQAMEEEVMKKHIALYVNKFSADLGEEGRKAIELMFNKAKELKLFDFGKEKLIID